MLADKKIVSHTYGAISLEKLKTYISRDIGTRNTYISGDAGHTYTYTSRDGTRKNASPVGRASLTPAYVCTR